MSRFNYQLNCGQYVLHDGTTPIQRVLDEVAICLDKEDGTRHKIGDPEMVKSWHKSRQAAFRAAGFNEIADALVVIQGRFTLEDLNKCFDITGYAGVLYAQVQAGTAASLDMFGKVNQQA